jgi:hypothetical protein
MRFALSLLALSIFGSAVGFSEAPVVIGTEATTDEIERTIIRRLIDAELFDMAIARCERLVSQPNIDPTQLAKRRALLVEAMIEQTASTATTIDEAMKLADRFLEQWKLNASPTLDALWLRTQIELQRFQLAKRSVANFQALPDGLRFRDDALAVIRSTLDRVESLQQATFESVADERERKGLSNKRDLAGLRNRLQLLKIDALLLRSDCYPYGSPDAVAAGADAIEHIRKFFNQVDIDWPGRDELELARFRSASAANLGESIAAELDGWLKTVDNFNLFARGSALAAEIEMRSGKLTQSTQRLASIANRKMSPELSLIELTVEIQNWNQSSGRNRDMVGSDSEAKLRAILGEKNRIARSFGSYWGRRAEAAVLSAGSGIAEPSKTSPSTSLDLIRLEIRQRIAAGNTQAAVTALDRAESIARENQAFDQAFAFAKSSIGLLQKVSQSQPANSQLARDWIVRATECSLRYADQVGADTLHSFAIDASQAVDRTRYSDLLLEHISTWPDSQTATQARSSFLQLSRLSDNPAWSVEKILDSIDAWPSDSLVEFMSTLHLHANAFLPFADTSEEFRDLCNRFMALTSDKSRNKIATRDTILFLTADWNHFLLDGGLSRIGERRARLVDSPDLSDEPIVRILAAAIRKQDYSGVEPAFKSLMELVESRRFGTLVELNLALSSILRRHATFNNNESNANGAWLQVWTAELNNLHQKAGLTWKSSAGDFSPSLRASIDDAMLIVAGRISGLSSSDDAGITTIQERASQSPRQIVWQLESALNSESKAAAAEMEKGLSTYRRIANGSKIGSDSWFEVKLGAIRLLERLGRSGEADELLKTIRALVPHPNFPWDIRLNQLQ